MDLARFCYRAKFRFFRAIEGFGLGIPGDFPSTIETPVIWYRAAANAEVFPGAHAFGNTFFNTVAENLNRKLGEIPGKANRRWSNGMERSPGGSGTPCGTPDQWRRGLIGRPASLPVRRNVFGLPICCGAIVHAHLGLTAPLPLPSAVGLAAPFVAEVPTQLGLSAVPPANATLGLLEVLPKPAVAVGEIGLSSMTVPAAAIGVSAVPVRTGELGVTAAIVATPESVIGLPSADQFQAWADGSIGLSALTPNAGAIGLVGEQPVPGYGELRVRLRCAGGLPSDKSVGLSYYFGAWSIWVWDDGAFTPGYTEIPLSLEFDTWYDLVIENASHGLYITLGSETAYLETSHLNHQTGFFVEFSNHRGFGNTPVSVDNLTVETFADGLVWSDDFVDADGTLAVSHTPDVSPGGAGYTTWFTNHLEIRANTLKVVPDPDIHDYGVVIFDPGVESYDGTVTTVIRVKIQSL